MPNPISGLKLPAYVRSGHFATADYVVFAITLAVSASIGFFFACTGEKQKTTKEFLLANRSMHFMPIAISMLVTFMSAITLLGTPAEIYIYGSQYWVIGLSYILVMPVSAYIFLPIFYRLRITSVFEYIEMRFNSVVRCLTVVVFLIQMLFYLAIVLYAPSLALSAVTGFNVWAAVWSVGLVCTLYTTIGGMKAVMWTDCFQATIMFLSMIIILGVGSSRVGGFAKAWNIYERLGRVEFFNFSPDMTVRHTVWGLIIGAAFSWTGVYAVSQAQVQRALSSPTLVRGQWAYLLNIPGLIVLLILVAMIGVVIFARYFSCDPLTIRAITAKDQLLPFFVMDILGDTAGLPGLFISGLFSGALSTISSGLNCLAAVILQDFIRRFWKPDLPERKATTYSKLLVFVMGILVIALTYIASLLGGILEAALALFGILGGPILGVFTLGILFPWANSKGAAVGFIVSTVFDLWIGIGSKVVKPPYAKPNIYVFGCRGYNGTTPKPGFRDMRPRRPQIVGINRLYSISYIWYSFIGVTLVCFVGLIVSFLTGFNRGENVNSKYICPVFDVLCPYLPKKLRQFLRCGVDYTSKKRPESITNSVVSFNPTIEYSQTPTVSMISLPSAHSRTSVITYESSV